jgi:PEP-CTERM motif
LKKFFVVPFLALGLSSISTATTLVTDVCTITVENGGNALSTSGGPLNINGCNLSANVLPGTAINIQMNLNWRFDMLMLDGNPATISISIDGPGSSWDVASTIVTDLTRPQAGASGFLALGGADLATYRAGGGFTPTISWTGASNNVDSANARLTYTITYDDAAPPTVPEPSTFLMLGSALTGLGVYARRRKA